MLVNIRDKSLEGQSVWLASNIVQECKISCEKIIFMVKPHMSISYPVAEFADSSYAKTVNFYDNKAEAEKNIRG